MNTGAPKDEDLAVGAAIETRQTAPPPHAGGDTIIASVGGGAQHVVVGKNIRIGNFNVPRWLLYVVGASCAVLLLFVALQTPQLVTIARAQAPLVKCLYPLEMDDTQFNVVMTPFTTVGGEGRMAPSHDGDELARILFRYLQSDLGQNSAPAREVRSPQQACALTGSTDAAQLASAEELAQKVHANVVVYGVIRPHGHRRAVRAPLLRQL